LVFFLALPSFPREKAIRKTTVVKETTIFINNGNAETNMPLQKHHFCNALVAIYLFWLIFVCFMCFKIIYVDLCELLVFAILLYFII